MKRRTDIEVTPLVGGIWRLNEYDLANCYLIEGTRKACLIDTGVGIADVAAAVSKMTDKPLTVLVTHAHEDHLGGGGWFKEVFVHPADRLTGLLSVNPFVKMWYLSMQNGKRKKYAIPYRAVFRRDHIPKLRKLNDGDTFDLGGRKIEAYLTPGHSAGSVTFRDTQTGTVFSGDNVDRLTTLQYPLAATVKVWLESAEKTLSLAGDAPVYAGHGRNPLSRNDLETLIAWGREIVAAGNEKPGRVRTRRGEYRFPCIVYRTDRVE